MTKHTPGPWRVNHEGTFDNEDHYRHEFSIQTPVCDHDNNIGIATAKLIEAAPDLLEALNEVIEFHDYIRGMSFPPKQNAMRMKLRAIVKAAIEKATGEPHITKP